MSDKPNDSANTPRAKRGRRLAYEPHPEGTAHERWQKSRSHLTFREWCEGEGLAER